MKDNKLLILMGGDYKMELIPVSKTKFIVDGFSPEVTYTFILDKEGMVEKYRVEQEAQGVNKEATRLR